MAQEMDLAPVSLRKAFDHVTVIDLLNETDESLKRAESGDGRFPEGHRRGGPLWRKDLIGWPFVICSDPVFRTEPAKKLDDGRRFDAREIACLWVAQVDLDKGEIGEAQLATLHGTYLLNQLRALTGQLAAKKLWTIARNPAMPHNEQWGYPYMLATFDRTKDSPLEGELSAGAFPEEKKSPVVAGNVASRMAEIEAAGGAIHPEDEEGPKVRGARPSGKP